MRPLQACGIAWALGMGVVKMQTENRAWSSLPATVVIVAAWGVVNAAVRLFAGTRLAFDDAKENLFTQSLQAGYLPDNPPLFEWLLIGVQTLMGPTLISFLILKYVLLTLAAMFAWLTARRLLGSNTWAAITVFSLVTLYQFGWNYHQAFTHSAVLVASVAAASWASVRLVQERRFADYLILGLTFGLGCLSKYNFAGFILVMLAALLLVKETRSVVLSVWMVPVFAIAALMVAPNILYGIEHRALYEFYLDGKLGLSAGSWGERVAEGLENLVVAVLSFFLPALIIVALLARGTFSKSLPLAAGGDGAVLKAFGWTGAISVLVILAGVLAFGIPNISERYVIPFFYPAFFWLMARVKAAHESREKSPRGWLTAVGLTAGVIVALRFTILAVPEEALCRDCAEWAPYEKLAADLEARGAGDGMVLVASNLDTAGNLRRHFPGATVRALTLPFYMPVPDAAEPSCLFVWSLERGRPLAQYFADVAASPETVTVSHAWDHPFRASWKTGEWGITPIAPGSDFYGRYCAQYADPMRAG